MEDETSLLGQNLTDALPLRIGDCEVFIPILTKISNDATWMRREFDWAQSTILPAMIDRVADAQKIVENAQAQNPGDLDLARMCWALGTYSASGTDRLEWIRLATEKNNLCMTLAFPVKRIGSNWQVLLQMEAAPLSYILPEDWANYCIPQIAGHIVWSAAAQGISVKK